MDCIKQVAVFLDIDEGISLFKIKWEIGLWVNVNTNDVMEAAHAIAHCRPPSPTEQVKQPHRRTFRVRFHCECM